MSLLLATFKYVVERLLDHVFGNGGFFALGIDNGSTVHYAFSSFGRLLDIVILHYQFLYLAHLQYRHSEIVSPREI